jgi:NAD(P)H-dependent flavin oxidoreductase YrpB (nitropropane dioxygenase family)
MLTTPLCKLLGIQLPIFSAPMGPDLTGPELVAAVSGAGGLGLMQSQLSPKSICANRYGECEARRTSPSA